MQGIFGSFGVEILKNGEVGLVFCRFAFVLLAEPLEDVLGWSVVDSCEDLRSFGCVGVEILKKPKKVDFWFDFRRFWFVSLGVPSGDVGVCSGDV